MTISVNAVNITFEVRQSGVLVNNANLQIRGLNGTGDYTCTNGTKIVNLTAGGVVDIIGINSRNAGYLACFRPTSITIPSSPNTYTLSITSDTAFKACGYTAPFSSYTVSSGIGWRVYNNELQLHTGVDLPKSQNTSIKSICYTNNFTSGYNSGEGNYVHMTASIGYYMRYMHMNIQTDFGGISTINQGDIVGVVGCTPYLSGYHLHLDIQYSSAYYDPLGFFN